MCWWPIKPREEKHFHFTDFYLARGALRWSGCERTQMAATMSIRLLSHYLAMKTKITWFPSIIARILGDDVKFSGKLRRKKNRATTGHSPWKIPLISRFSPPNELTFLSTPHSQVDRHETTLICSSSDKLQRRRKITLLTSLSSSLRCAVRVLFSLCALVYKKIFTQEFMWLEVSVSKMSLVSRTSMSATLCNVNNHLLCMIHAAVYRASRSFESERVVNDWKKRANQSLRQIIFH